MEPTPQKIGKYEIVAPLGQGAMGMVYKAFDPMIGRFVALKTMNLSFSQPADDDITRRFHREAQAAGNLNHPNIVGIYEYGEDQGRAYIAMEYVEGRTLLDMLKHQHAFGLEDIRRIFTSVLDALDYSHRMGVVHRDIKPGNIMLDPAGTVKVMDFGVARIESSDLTQAGTILGTPGYMSPEQLLGETVDLRSDLYSAGVVLYELLTGERAFTGSSFASVIYKVINIDLSPPSRLKPAVPGSLDGLVARACAKQAGERFQTAAEFASEMNRALTAGGTSEQAGGSPAVVKASKHKPTAGGDRPPPPKAVKKWIAAAALLATAAGIALAVWFLLPDGRETQPMAEHAPGSTFRDCDTCPEMVVIPAGQFVQGSADTDASRQVNEEPRRLVSIDYPLAVSRHEITRAQFAQFVADTGHTGAGCNAYDGVWAADSDRSWRSPGFDQDDTHPATCISWDDAQAYIGWLNRRSGQTYRLLSASEWEYAALAGKASGGVAATETARICESANVADRSTADTYPGWDIFNCQDSYVHTAPVGSFQANAFGIHDMLGNVFEWVQDCWNQSYAEAPSDGSAWLDGDCGYRVLRGGSWFTPPGYVHTAFRNRFAPDYRSSSFGLRVARLP